MAHLNCTHRYIIDPPDGQFSKGTCIFCNMTKKFSNWAPVPSGRNFVGRPLKEAKV